MSGGSSLCRSLPGGHFLDRGCEVNHRDINCKVAQSHDSELAGEARYGHELQAVGVVDRRALTNRQAGQQHNSSRWEKGGGVRWYSTVTLQGSPGLGYPRQGRHYGSRMVCSANGEAAEVIIRRAAMSRLATASNDFLRGELR